MLVQRSRSVIALKRRQCGFTLIEVLVALVIIAIACTAVVRAISSGILVSSHLQTSLVSRWVADNVLAQLQNGLLPSPRQNAEQNGTVKMWERNWAWSATTSADSSNAYYQQVVINVGSTDGKSNYYQLRGFVWDPLTKAVG